MIRQAVCLLAAAVVLSALATACGSSGGGGGGTKTAGRTVAPANTSKQHTPVALTGTPVLDQVIGAALAADDIELAGLAGYQKLPCKKDSSERNGAPPNCRDNENDGTQVEALPSSACNLGWVRPEQVPDAFRYNLSPEAPEIVLVYKPRFNRDEFGGGFATDVVAVFRTNKHAEGPFAGVAFHIKGGRVVWIEADCRNLNELTARLRIDSVIYDAATGVPAAAATAAAEPPTAAPTSGN